VPAHLRNPLHTTSFGTGELILAALDQGADKIILGIGGSATNDGGLGMMQALGAIFKDANNQILALGCGENLSKINKIDLSKLDKRLSQTKIVVACDVDNPLCGTNGAANVFAPQKGATPQMVQVLDQALWHFGCLIEQTSKIAVINASGAGAAGGIGASLLGLLQAELKAGVQIVLETLNFADAVKDADLVITGEGRLDFQTIKGKTPIGVAKAAKEFNIPVIALAGILQDGHQNIYENGIDAAFSILNEITSLEDALNQAQTIQRLKITARNIAAIWQMRQSS